jgi:hypothetical protein
MLWRSPVSPAIPGRTDRPEPDGDREVGTDMSGLRRHGCGATVKRACRGAVDAFNGAGSTPVPRHARSLEPRSMLRVLARRRHGVRGARLDGEAHALER